jgi:hypothetical protein
MVPVRLAEVNAMRVSERVVDGVKRSVAAVYLVIPADLLERAEALRDYVRRRPRWAASGVATRATVLRVALGLGLSAIERDRDKRQGPRE